MRNRWRSVIALAPLAGVLLIMALGLSGPVGSPRFDPGPSGRPMPVFPTPDLRCPLVPIEYLRVGGAGDQGRWLWYPLSRDQGVVVGTDGWAEISPVRYGLEGVSRPGTGWYFGGNSWITSQPAPLPKTVPAAAPWPGIANLREHAFSYDVSPDGTRLAVHDANGALRLWDLATGAEIMSLADRGIQSSAFSPDGTWLSAVVDNSTLHLWDVVTGRLLMTWRPPDTAGLATGLSGPAFSPDGQLLLVIYGPLEPSKHPGAAGVAYLLESATGATRASLFDVDNVMFTPDGAYLAVLSQNRRQLMLWDIAANRGHLRVDEAHYVQFSRDGTKVAVWGARGTEDVRIFDVSGGYEQARWTAPSHANDRTPRSAENSPGILSVAFSPDDTTLAITYGSVYIGDYEHFYGVTYLVDATTGRERLTAIGAMEAVFSFGGTRLITGASSATLFDSLGPDYEPAAGTQLWDTTTGALIVTLGVQEQVSLFSPNGQWFASVSWPDPSRANVTIWDLATGGVLTKFNAGRLQLPMAVSADGTLLVIPDGDGVVRLWRVGVK
jgi:WD40 repeat protein